MTPEQQEFMQRLAAMLIADLRATFPGIDAHQIGEFDNGRSGWSVGVWASGAALMPDGKPIFTQVMASEAEYEDGVHAAFRFWPEQRNWSVDSDDGSNFFIVPLGPHLPCDPEEDEEARDC